MGIQVIQGHNISFVSQIVLFDYKTYWYRKEHQIIALLKEWKSYLLKSLHNTLIYQKKKEVIGFLETISIDARNNGEKCTFAKNSDYKVFINI